MRGTSRPSLSVFPFPGPALLTAPSGVAKRRAIGVEPTFHIVLACPPAAEAVSLALFMNPLNLPCISSALSGRNGRRKGESVGDILQLVRPSS